MTAPLIRQTPIGEVPEVGTLWTVHNLEYSGIKPDNVGQGLIARHMFVRNELSLYWNQLNNAFSDRPALLSICGDPGVGKSTVLFGWTLWIVSTYDIRAVWLHTDDLGEVTVTSLNGAELTVSSTVLSNSQNEYDSYWAEIDRDGNYDLLVLDGFTGQMGNNDKALTNFVVKLCSRYEHALKVFCTSWNRLNLTQNSSYALGEHTYWVCGSTIEDYWAAWTASREHRVSLFPAELLASPVKFAQKYYYAGGSYRNMWKPTARVIQYLSTAVDQISSVQDFLRELMPRYTPHSTANRLCMHRRGDYGQVYAIVVSQYATALLSERATKADAERAKGLMPGNPTWHGWCFELQVLSAFRRAQRSASHVTAYRHGVNPSPLHGVPRRSRLWR